MKQHDDFLVEIHTEELPPKALLKLSEAFCQQIKDRLQKADLSFKEAVFFAAPCRLAVLVKELAAKQPDQEVERKGPALNAARNDKGEFTQASIGFARSCGVEPEKLMVLKTPQGEWLGYKQQVSGKAVSELLPAIVEQSLAALPIPKRMRWGAGEAQFVRPVHSVIMLYGDKIIDATVLGCRTDRKTRGHRFHAHEWLNIPSAADYLATLEENGVVMADFHKRRETIRNDATRLVTQKLGNEARLLISSDALLDEVTNLVEWPVALLGNIDVEFLKLPAEVLISSMQDHQRYFPVINPAGNLLPHFVTISNIKSQDVNRVIRGNERVLRARLSDAAFFYETDKKEPLVQRVERLKDSVFQAKLGTLYDKAQRVSQLASFIAKEMQVNAEDAARAGLLCKADLLSSMVGEFPELQGTMGGYYAQHDGENKAVSQAIAEQYHPRFSGDTLPESTCGQVLALADRIDTLVGTFGINQLPTGDKDPFGLRRAALGVLRIILEKKINLDLRPIIEFAIKNYAVKLENAQVADQLLNFFQERLRAWYQEQGIAADIFAAVAALSLSNPLDVEQRIKAVQAFKKLSQAETLSMANKRVSNILAKYLDAIERTKVDPTFFENAAELELASKLEAKSSVVAKLYQSGQYEQVLRELAELSQPIDNFFDQVMVMTEDKARRENRLLMLSQLRALFLQVADIALLQ